MNRAPALCSVTTLALLALSGCSSSDGPVEIPPSTAQPDPTARDNSGFEQQIMGANNTFTLGEAPVSARFEGGTAKQTRLANSGDWAWTIAEGGTGTITFSTPVTELVMWFTNELESALIIPDDDMDDSDGQQVQAVCGVSDQGMNNSEAFSAPLFLRGGFNDWGNSEEEGLAARFQLYNFGMGVYNAQFEIDGPDEYEFKIADGGWTIEYGNPEVDFVVDGTVTLSGGAALGGPNSNLIIDEPGCYNFQMTIVDDTAVPAPVADLLLSFVEIDPGDAVLARSELRVYDENGVLIGTFDGSDNYQRIEFVREAGQSAIRRIEVQSYPGDEGTIGIGEVAIDDFRFGVVPDETPRPVEIFYSRPGGDYSNTKIVVTSNGVTQELDCVPDGGFGCSVTASVLLGFDVNYQVINDGVPDQGGEIRFDVADARDNALYTFEGSNVPIVRDLPVVPQGDDEVVLYYFRPDGQYDGWGLHLFPQDGNPPWTMFTGGEYFPAGIDPELGAYFIIGLPGSPRLTSPYSGNPAPTDAFPESLGFVIHRGDDKDPGPDQFINVAQDGNVIFVTSGVVPVATTPPIPGAVSVIGAAAHWVSPTTLLWDAGDNVASVELLHSNAGAITTAGTGLVGQDGQFVLTPGLNPLPDGAGNQAHLAELAAYTLPPEASQMARELVRDQLVAVGFDTDGQRVAATSVQIPLVLDELFADDAEDAELGVIYDGGAPTLSVWAPTANSVAVNLYDDPSQDTPDETVAMTRDETAGVWSVTGPSSWNRRYYTYAVNVYSPGAAAVVDNVVTDPYSVSLSTGSASGRLVKSQIVDLADADIAPAGWATLEKPELDAPEDIVLYELHIRDFSALDDTVPEADRGKYSAFTGTGSGMTHLAGLAEAGLTHVHLLPTFDIATVNEDASQLVDITDTVDALCAANGAAQSLCDDFPGQRIIDVMAAQPGDSPLPQQINEWIKDLDGFNWGYDPFHFGVPEGSYASDPEGVARIAEFRGMVQGLSNIGLRTVMDVVYNHTNASGNVSDRSVLDRVVPGYYHRQSEFTGVVLNDSCCADTASEHRMMEKLIIDLSVRLARDYKVDGFRFDLMGFHSRDTMVKVRNALASLTQANDGVDGSTLYVYGEGWNFGDIGDDRRFVQATQANVAGTGIGSFNDRLRDSVRGGGPFDAGLAHVNNQGFISGQWYDANAQNDGDDAERQRLLGAADLIRLSMAGNLKNFEFEDNMGEVRRGDEINYAGQLAGYTEDPQEIINYIASHDGETLWDISAFKHPQATSSADRVRAHNVGQSIVLLGQGIPFLHAGQDMLRSKSMDRNSFDSGDWFNRLDFTYSDNNFAVGEPRNGENSTSLSTIRDVLGYATADASMDDILAGVDVTREFMRIRSTSRLFRLRNAAQIRDRVSYHNTGASQVPGVIVQSIGDGEKCTGNDLDTRWSRVVTVINPTTADQTLALFTDATLNLHPIQAGSSDSVVQGASHSATGFFVPARTTAVFVEDEPQIDCGNLGVDVYLRGSFNDFAADDNVRFDLRGNDVADLTVPLDSDLYFFKVADDTFEIANCGAAVSGAGVTLNVPFALVCGANSQNVQLDLRGELPEDFIFSLDVSDANAPAITVTAASLDLTPPSVAITTPTDNDIVAGNIVIRADATDEFDITAVRFFVDGTLIGTDTTPDGNEYSVGWDSSSVADGLRSLSVEAEDNSGNVGTSATVSVTVDSTLLDDNSPPVVALDPVMGALSGTVSLTATASDPQGGIETPTGVTQVSIFYDDGGGPQLIDTATSEPFSVSWDTTTVANGTYALSAEATDGAGNSATSDSIDADVDNAGTFGVDLFVCGLVSDCATPPGMDVQLAFAGNDTFASTLTLIGGTRYDLRIVDSDGVSVGGVLNCGSESRFTPIIPGQSFALDCTDTANDATLDLSTEATGDYVFTLDATDAANLRLTVSPAGDAPVGVIGDVTPPTVTVDGVLPGGIPASGQQTISASATDNASPIARVDFEVDGVLIWTDTTAPYEAPWATDISANGDRMVTATAVDAAGNQSTSTAVVVTLANLGPIDTTQFNDGMPVPLDEQGVFVRGSWDPNFALLTDQLPMDYLGGGVYQDTLIGELQAANPGVMFTGNLRFKVGPEGEFDDLTAANCNPLVDNTPAILNEPLEFVCGPETGNARFDISLEDPADYVFTLDASRSSERPQMTVSRADPGPDPVPGDEQAPVFLSVLTLDPADDPVQFGVTISASVSDDNEVASVTFLVDNEVIWADFTDPFQAPWDSTLVENGSRTITAIATDANGNVGTAQPLVVNVANPDFGPFGVPMFVRGAFVDDSMLQFNTESQLVLQVEGGSVYESTVTIDRSDMAPTEFFIGFKIADAGWTEGTNCGAPGPGPTTIGLGADAELVCSAADNGDNNSVNVTLNLLGQPQPDEYVFTIDATGFPDQRPTVRVELAP